VAIVLSVAVWFLVSELRRAFAALVVVLVGQVALAITILAVVQRVTNESVVEGMFDVPGALKAKVLTQGDPAAKPSREARSSPS